MHKLSGETVRLISSAQVITSIASVVKELVENSLDANADNIEIKLDNFGIDKVEIRDNGDGIQPEDADFMGRRHYTSKLSSHDDLESLMTYGFRGEALGSLCAVSNVAIATKTKDEEVGRCYLLDHEGLASSPKPSQCCTGTTVTASRLFHNIPVRKQYYSNAKRRRDELKKVEDLLLSFGVVCPGVRLSLSHNKTSIWQKNKVPNVKAALLNTVGSSVMGQLTKVKRSDPETQVKIEGFLPKPDSDTQLTTRATDDRTWISVNGRPVTMKDISKVVKQYFTQAHSKAGNVRHIVMCLAVTMPTHLVDVNLEPNKTKVLLQNNDAVICLIIQMLEELYNTTPTIGESVPEQSQNQPPPSSSTQTATCTTCQSDLRQPGEESKSTREQSQNQALPRSSTQTATGTTCQSDVRQPGEESKSTGVASHDVSECAEPVASTAANESDGLSMICDLLMDTDTPTSDRTTQNHVQRANEGDSFLEPPLPNFSILEEDGEHMFAACLQSTLSIQPEASTTQTKVVDVPERPVANTEDDRNLEDASIGKRSVEDPVANCNLDLLDAVGGGDGAKELDDALWSKGCGLREPSGKVVQPSVLLIPGRQELSQNDTRKATSSTESSFQASLPCVIRPLQEHDNNRDTIVRIPQASGNSSLFTTSVTNAENNSMDTSARIQQASGNSSLFTVNISNAENQNKSAISSSGGQLSSCNSPGHMNWKSGTPSSGEVSFCSSPEKMKRPVEERSSPGSQYDLVGKAPIKRPQDAFAFFLKEKKPEILRQHPTLDFASVNKILQRQWDELDEEETIKYKELEARDLQRYKDQVVCAKQSLTTKNPSNGLPAKKKKKIEKLSNQSLIDEMLASQRERKQKEALAEEEDNPKRLETRIPFSVSSLREVQPGHEMSTRDTWRLVGGLPGHGVWTAIKGRKLSVFNQYKAQEVVLYHRLLATHKLPCRKLPVPIILTAGMFGEQKNWYTLLGMKSQVNPVDQSRLFIDERLLLNGFEIRQLIDPDTMDAKLEVVSMSMKIVPFYGLHDLIEIVETIATQRAQLVAECRPLKLANHLMGEAVRMARSLPNTMTEEEVKDIMDAVEGLTMWKSRLCLHGKGFVQDICTIPDVDPD